MPDNSSTDLLPGLFAPPRLPWESIMDSVRDGVLCVENGGNVIYVNQALEAILGVSRADVIGNPISFSPELRALFDEAAKVHANQTSHALLLDRELVWKSERDGEISLTVTITGAIHQALRIQIAVIRDLSNLKRMEEAVVQSRKVQAVGALAGGIAHDFNNILTALLSQLDLALDEPNLPGGAREHIVHAQTSGRRAAELISRLQTFSRQTESRTTTVDLAQLIEQVVLILRRSIDRRIEIVTDRLEAGRWLVKADASQVLQVVFNLCLNARDAMASGGKLHIQARRVRRSRPESDSNHADQGWVRITVSDTGPGMSPEVMNRLFEPYFTTKTLGRGTGLGLSIAQSIIQDQGGWLEAESRPGHGSSFHAYLPETGRGSATDSSALHEFTSAETRALEGRESILIVDDEEMVRLVMKAVLSYRGYRITEAADGRDMLDVVQRTNDPFDLVLLDLDMPRLNGWEALAQLKECRPQARVILLSGGAVDSDQDQAKARGADAFLAKPFKNEQLVQLVRQTLDAADSKPAHGRPAPAP